MWRSEDEAGKIKSMELIVRPERFLAGGMLRGGLMAGALLLLEFPIVEIFPLNPKRVSIAHHLVPVFP